MSAARHDEDRLREANEAKTALQLQLMSLTKKLKATERELRMERGELDESDLADHTRRLQTFNRMRVRNLLCGDETLTIEEFIDAFNALYEETTRLNVRQRNADVTNFLKKYDPRVKVLREMRALKAEYDIVKKIGQGSVAEIFLAKNLITGRPVVVKQMEKSLLQGRPDSACYKEELSVLIRATGSHSPTHEREPGITALQHAFYDKRNVYLITDFYPGGDLLGLLTKHERFGEDMARFYLAQLIEAVHTVHKLGYVHRDVKIENMYINHKGHVFLGDFGSCGKLNSKGHVTTNVSGGTPEYMSPELLSAMQGDRRVQYGTDCDWWSVGVIMYELLVGETPFFAESVLGTYKNIKNFKKSLVFPDDGEVEISSAAKDLIRALCADQKDRLNYDGLIKHPFFANIVFDNIRKMRPPFVPELASPFDSAFFEDQEDEDEDDAPTGVNGGMGGIGGGIGSSTSSSNIGGDAFGQQFWLVGYAYRYPYPERDAASSLAAASPHHGKKRLSSHGSDSQREKRLSGGIRLSFNEPTTMHMSSSSKESSMDELGLASGSHDSCTSVSSRTIATAIANERHFASSVDVWGDVQAAQALNNASPAAATGGDGSSSESSTPNARSLISAKGAVSSGTSSERAKSAPPTSTPSDVPTIKIGSPIGSPRNSAMGKSSESVSPVPGDSASPTATAEAASASGDDSEGPPALDSMVSPALARKHQVDTGKTGSDTTPTTKGDKNSDAGGDGESDATAGENAAEMDATATTTTKKKKAGRSVKFTDEVLFYALAADGELDEMRSMMEQNRAAVDQLTELDQTALHASSSAGQVEVVAALLEMGADVNAMDKDNNTPLHLAIVEDQLEVAQLLVNAGADLFAINVEEDMPVDMSDSPEVIEAFQKKMDEIAVTNPELVRTKPSAKTQKSKGGESGTTNGKKGSEFTSVLSSSEDDCEEFDNDDTTDDDEDDADETQTKKKAPPLDVLV